MKTTSFVYCALLCVLTSVAAWAQDVPPPPSALTFESAKALIVKDGKSLEVPVRLRLDGAQVVIEEASSGKVILALQNAEVKAAEYSYSKHRRWQPLAISSGAFVGGTMLGLALLADSAGWIAVGGFLTLPVAGILFFTHSKKHWLTIRGTDGLAMLRLDKSNYRRVIPALENQTGITVAQQGER